MVPVRAGDPVSKDNPAGGPGNYAVTFLLQKPGYSLFEERRIDFGSSAGDSHVFLGSATAKIRIDITLPDGQAEIIGSANGRGALGGFVIRVAATGFHDASARAIRILSPSLSHWSAMLDVPIQVARIELVEEGTGARQMGFVNPFQDTPFQPASVGGKLTHDLRVLLSYYREALNSNSDPYQLLCFFKIIEGVRNRRVRNLRQARKAGTAAAAAPVETVPANPQEFPDWLAPLFPFRNQPWDELALESIFIPEVRGQTIHDLVKPGDRHDRTSPGPLCALRNEVSHSIGPSGGGIPLVADESLHTIRVGNWLPITKCIVRLLLMNEFPNDLWRPVSPDQVGGP